MLLDKARLQHEHDFQIICVHVLTTTPNYLSLTIPRSGFFMPFISYFAAFFLHLFPMCCFAFLEECFPAQGKCFVVADQVHDCRQCHQW